MGSVNVSRTIPAPQSAVWAVLADFPNIADWNTGVAKSHATGEAVAGVGATRHCDLAQMGATLEETIREWQPEDRLVITIDSATRVPIKSATATFELTADGDSTKVVMIYDYDTKYGVVGRLMGSMMDKQFTKGFEGFLADLDTAARKAAPAASDDRPPK